MTNLTPSTFSNRQSSAQNRIPATWSRLKPWLRITLGVITLASATGKFYVQPGQGDVETYLGDDLVLAPTELRRGDHVRIGDIELRLFRKGEEGA